MIVMCLGTGTETANARDGHEGPEQREIHERQGAFAGWLGVISIAALASLILNVCVVKTFVVISTSMEGTLLVGDFLVVNRAVLGARIPFTNNRLPGYSSLRRRDVIVFQPPPADLVGLDLVKRVIGIPGDTIRMHDRVVYVDGQRLDEPYARQTGEKDVFDLRMAWQTQYLTHSVDPRTYAPARDNWGPLTIPPNCYFVLGDNREKSVDSRYWGFVDVSQVEGRADFVYFSYHKKSSRPSRWIDEIRWGRIGRAIH
jgi:signal peptidase I